MRLFFMAGVRDPVRALLTGAAVLLVVLGCAAPASARGVPKGFYGVVPQASLRSSDYGLMRKAGVGTLRVLFNWGRVRPNPIGPRHWRAYDATVRAAADRGIRVLPVLYGTPHWVGFCSSPCPSHAPVTTSELSLWKTFVAAAEKRYGPGGTFWRRYRGRDRPIRAWQIWNEQNSPKFFSPRPNPALYAKMLGRAATAIHARDRKADLILGGMFGTPGSGGQSIATADYLRRLYRVHHIKRAFSGIAIHPYSRTVGFVKHQVELARRELRRAHDSKTDLWITEIGWASGGSPSALNVGSKRAQAKRLKAAYKMFKRHRRGWNVRSVEWFAWQDNPASASFCFFCAKSGLVTKGGRPKPAYRAFKRIAKRR